MSLLSSFSSDDVEIAAQPKNTGMESTRLGQSSKGQGGRTGGQDRPVVWGQQGGPLSMLKNQDTAAKGSQDPALVSF